ncbi:MAG: OmpH family outer membrane protein [Bacteroidia bacterium]|nr:OmpH family outer membrane protein [Bacteroidia bacterium]
MKKLIFLFFVFASCTTLFAQKFGYVDTEYILNQIPEYKAAQAELDKASGDWEKEITAKYTEIKKLKDAFEAEKIFLTDEMMKKRQGEMDIKETEVRELQKQKFGIGGELFKKRMELVKPLQDKVYSAVKAIAEKSGLAIIFDKSSDLTMLYTSPRYDKSDDVLNYMGYNKK